MDGATLGIPGDYPAVMQSNGPHVNLTAVTPKRVRELRGDRTQAVFARILGVQVQTIRNWESGRTQPGGVQLMLLHAFAEGKAPIEPGLSQATDEELLAEVMRRMKRAVAEQ